MKAAADHIYVIPPNKGLTIIRGVLRLTPRKKDGVHLPIDQFFQSLARDQGNRAIGIVLSGNAQDGTAGLREIKAEGGITFAQDQKTAKFPGMPQSALASGCVDFILSPAKMANKLGRIASHSALRVTPERGEARSAPPDSSWRGFSACCARRPALIFPITRKRL